MLALWLLFGQIHGVYCLGFGLFNSLFSSDSAPSAYYSPSYSSYNVYPQQQAQSFVEQPQQFISNPEPPAVFQPPPPQAPIVFPPLPPPPPPPPPPVDGSVSAPEPAAPSPTYPLPSCYTNTHGYMCCNNSLEQAMQEAFRQLRSTEGADWSTCNQQWISNAVQNQTQLKFSGYQFEVITGISDYASKSHFYDDLICKVRWEDRIVLAYASSAPPNYPLPPPPPPPDSYNEKASDQEVNGDDSDEAEAEYAALADPANPEENTLDAAIKLASPPGYNPPTVNITAATTTADPDYPEEAIQAIPIARAKASLLTPETSIHLSKFKPVIIVAPNPTPVFLPNPVTLQPIYQRPRNKKSGERVKIYRVRINNQ